jgi:predicted AAA+ superfamily ATPase
MLTGGFPELLLRTEGPPTDERTATFESQRTLRADAVERVVWKDIPQALPVENPMVLERLLYVLGGQIGGIMSPESICASVRDISTPTFDRYLRYLELAYLTFTLQNYAPREETRQRRGRKIYFTNVAVRNAALQRGLAPVTDPAELGIMLENTVASHLHALAQQGEGRSFYWRQGKAEVDFIHDDPAGPVAIEVSASLSHTTDHLVALAERHPRLAGRCYLAAPGPLIAEPPRGTSPGLVSLDRLLLAIGAHVGAAMKRRLGNTPQIIGGVPQHGSDDDGSGSV